MPNKKDNYLYLGRHIISALMNKKLIIFAPIFSIVLNLLIMIFYTARAESCGEMCWGGTMYTGWPLEWYSYGMGDVISGAEWMRGAVTSWVGLIGDLIFWFIVGAAIFVIFNKLRKS